MPGALPGGASLNIARRLEPGSDAILAPRPHFFTTSLSLPKRKGTSDVDGPRVQLDEYVSNDTLPAVGFSVGGSSDGQIVVFIMPRAGGPSTLRSSIMISRRSSDAGGRGAKATATGRRKMDLGVSLCESGAKQLISCRYGDEEFGSTSTLYRSNDYDGGFGIHVASNSREPSLTLLYSVTVVGRQGRSYIGW